VGPVNLSPDLTPLAAGELAGLGMNSLLSCGLMAVLKAPRIADGEDGASGYLADSLAGLVVHRPDSPSQTGAARRQAADLIVSPRTRPTLGLKAVVRRVMVGLGNCADDDLRHLGLIRDTTIVRRILLLVAGIEALLLIRISAGFTSDNIRISLFIAAVLTAYSGFHLDRRTASGVVTSVQLRRLRDQLRLAARDAGSLDSLSMQVLIPAAKTAAELEIWAVAVGCETPGFVETKARLWAIARSTAADAHGIDVALLRDPHIRQGGMTEAWVATIGRLTGLITSPFFWAWRAIRGPRQHASSYLW
jgi:hypothetical protein